MLNHEIYKDFAENIFNYDPVDNSATWKENGIDILSECLIQILNSKYTLTTIQSLLTFFNHYRSNDRNDRNDRDQSSNKFSRLDLN